MNALLSWQEWQPAGHADALAWSARGGQLALLVLGLGYLALVVRALRRQRWYRAEGVLSPADIEALHAALATAERRTVGEILPVVLERSDRHPGACWLAALTCVLLGSVGLELWLALSGAWLLLAQFALGALGYASARSLADFQRFFVSEGEAQRAAEEQALLEFQRHELARTAGRTGVLVFVSLFERRALVLADEGIHAKVGPEHWTRTNDRVLEGVRRGQLGAGLEAGIESAGAVLAEHFPSPDGAQNEIPDRVIVRRE
ncbi:MAG: hypothetical protein EXS08_00730 [Planctomycetes bacterium]|nr:hypothetical protein [Planctomycetota bacterium]